MNARHFGHSAMGSKATLAICVIESVCDDRENANREIERTVLKI